MFILPSGALDWRRRGPAAVPTSAQRRPAAPQPEPAASPGRVSIDERDEIVPCFTAAFNCGRRKDSSFPHRFWTSEQARGTIAAERKEFGP